VQNASGTNRRGRLGIPVIEVVHVGHWNTGGEAMALAVISLIPRKSVWVWTPTWVGQDVPGYSRVLQKTVGLEKNVKGAANLKSSENRRGGVDS